MIAPGTGVVMGPGEKSPAFILHISSGMKTEDLQTIETIFHDFIAAREFPCIAAKAALSKAQAKCMVAGHMGCPSHDRQILDFLYHFIDEFRNADNVFHSAAIIFTQPEQSDESNFDRMMWMRLQALSNLDALNFAYDHRVADDPASPDFSFSLKQESFFIIGLHPGSSRPARRFKLPTLVFNPHMQFEQLRQADRYDMMKQAIRKRDVKFAGSVNPMLRDFGEQSEVFQYSGKEYAADWKCPLNIQHAGTNSNSTT